MKILIVDDNLENIKMLAQILESKNHDVASANNGKEALKILYSDKFNLIISDILMPVMDGFQLCRECKKEAKLKDICFVFYTETFTDDIDEKFALSLGAQKFIRKPREPEAFLNLIEESAEKSKSEEIAHRVQSEQGEEEILKPYNERLITRLERRNIELENKILSDRMTTIDHLEGEERYRSLISQSSEGVILVDSKGIITDCNRAFELITELNPEQIIDKPFWEVQLQLLPPDSNLMPEIESFKNIFHEVIRSGKSKYFYKPFTINILTSKGGYKTLLQSLFPVKTNKEYYLGALVSDITKLTMAEEALRASEEKYRSIVETTTEWIWEIDLEGKHIFSNKAVTAILGYLPEEIIGQSSFILMHEEDRLEVEKKLPQLIAEKDGWNRWIVRWRHKDGNYRFLESNAKPVYDSKGNIRGYLGSDRDITERIQTEEALSESEMKYRTIVTHSPDGIFIMDFDCNFLSVNKSLCEILRYTEEELLSMKFWDILPRRFLSLVKKRIAVIRKGKVNEAAKYELFDKEGNEHTFQIRSAPFFKDKKIIGLQGIARDITEQQKVENKLSQERILMRTLIDNLPDNIYVKDIEMRKVLANKADLALIGRSEEEVIGKDDSELFPPEIAASFMADDRLVLEKGQSILNREEKLVNHKNQRLWLLTSKLPLYDHEGNISGLIGIGHNITERKKAMELLKESERKLRKKNKEYQKLNHEYLTINEELTESIERVQKMNEELRFAKEKAEESDRLKTTFLANMSHEIRTPMNAILGFSQILKDIRLEDKQRIHYLDVINKSCERLLSVVNDIIDISKIESGLVSLQYDDININDLLDELFELYYESCSSKNISLIINKQLSKNEINCSTDAVKLEQVLSILVDNAIKFTHSGSISVFSGIKDNMFEFAVRDTGIGIDEKDLNIVFERFRQADDRSTREYGGTGLGLAIAKAYVNMLGGKIWIESTKGRGTTIFFNIPFIPASSIQTSQLKDIKTKKYNWSGKKILIAEDEMSNFEYIAEVLDDSNATLYHAKNGEEAVSLFENNSPDLILMDIKMPKMDGILATKKIRKKNKKIPVIALTAYAMEVDKTETRKAGFNDHITKPVYYDTLLSTLNKYLS